MRPQEPLQGAHKRALWAPCPEIDVIRPRKDSFWRFIKTLKTHKKYAFTPRFYPKTPQILLFLGFSSIFLITFFGENEIMCTFAPK